MVCKTANKYYTNIMSFWETLSLCFVKRCIFNIDIRISEQSSCDTFCASIVCTDLKTAYDVCRTIEFGYYGSHTTLVNKEDISTELLFFSVNIDVRLYDVFKENITKHVGESNKLGRKIRLTECAEDYGRCTLTVSSKHSRYTMLMRTFFNKIVQPTIILPITSNFQRYFTCSDASLLLDGIGRRTNTFIHISPEQDSLYVYGLHKDAPNVDIMLNNCLSASPSSLVENTFGWFYMRIHSGGDIKKIGELCRRLSASDTVCKRWSVEHIAFLPRQDHVVFKSRDDNIVKTKQRIRSDLNSIGILCSDVNTRESQCCTCFASVHSHESYTLQQCDHTYCKECIQLQIQCALNTSTLPINCAECSTPVSYVDLKMICGADVLNKLHKASFNIFIRTHKQYSYCPDHNCSGAADVRVKYSCMLCQSKLCCECMELSHETMSCEEYTYENTVIDNWINENSPNRKRCPSCGIGIEKYDGCLNVCCATCKKNVCWKCFQFFDSGGECYIHLDKEHGGYWQDR